MEYGKLFRKETAICVLAVLAVSYLFFFYNLGSYSLKEPDEGRYAEIPREMVEQGDYVVPHLDYVRYFEKPPLLYWTCAVSYKLFGVSEWSFRFPNAAAALAGVLVAGLFAGRWFSARAGLISGLILMTSFGFFALARVVTVDMLFSFLLFSSLACFSQFYRERRHLFLYLSWAALALAVLAKGPVAPVLLGASVVLFLGFEKNLRFLKEAASPRAILLFAVIALPWFVLMCVKEKGFAQFFFVDQHVLRFLTTKHSRSGPLYYFLPVLFGGLFPWSIFIPRAVIFFWRKREMRLLLIWSCVVFTFFSVSGSKLPPYILPLFPALSIVLGCLFDGQWRSCVPPRRERIVYTVFFACLAGGGLILGTGAFDRYLAGATDVVALAGDIRGLSLGMSLVSFVMLFILARKGMGSFRSLFTMLGAFSLSVVIGIMLHSHVIDRVNTTKGLAAAIQKAGKEHAIVINYGSFDETLPFYLGKRTYLADVTGELEMGAKYPDSKYLFLNGDEAARLFHADTPVFVVVKEKRLAEMKRLGIEDPDMICQDERCLIANRSAAVTLRLTPSPRKKDT
jgi:4-amino-4-deoxy-L-arabinose transferase-like glycosyltransferase